MKKTSQRSLLFRQNVNRTEVKGVPEKGLLRSRNIGQVDWIWPRKPRTFRKQ